ncbi:hypothetical protein D9M68_280560 [compost metagenome]
MKTALELILESFTDQLVAAQRRPDGSWLLELKDVPDCPFRVIDAHVLACPRRIEQFVRQIQRELKLKRGELRWHTADDASISTALPTYTGQAIYLRAMQTLVQRRKLHQARQQA